MHRSTSSPFAPIRRTPRSGPGDQSPLRGGEHAHCHRGDGRSPAAAPSIRNSSLGAGAVLGAGGKTPAERLGGGDLCGGTAGRWGGARRVEQRNGGGGGAARGSVAPAWCGPAGGA